MPARGRASTARRKARRAGARARSHAGRMAARARRRRAGLAAHPWSSRPGGGDLPLKLVAPLRGQGISRSAATEARKRSISSTLPRPWSGSPSPRCRRRSCAASRQSRRSFRRALAVLGAGLDLPRERAHRGRAGSRPLRCRETLHLTHRGGRPAEAPTRLRAALARLLDQDATQPRALGRRMRSPIPAFDEGLHRHDVSRGSPEASSPSRTTARSRSAPGTSAR